jgi:hypothetical protein
VKAAGGHVDVVETTQLGMHGNSHMLMQDRNNLKIADVVTDWTKHTRSIRRSRDPVIKQTSTLLNSIAHRSGGRPGKLPVMFCEGVSVKLPRGHNINM